MWPCKVDCRADDISQYLLTRLDMFPPESSSKAAFTSLQRDAEGNGVKSTAWWDGEVHKSRMEGGKHGSIESWRYMDGGLMVVKTVLISGKHGKPVTMHWYLEALDVPGMTHWRLFR